MEIILFTRENFALKLPSSTCPENFTNWKSAFTYSNVIHLLPSLLLCDKDERFTEISFMQMGYGKRALQQLITYYEGKIQNLSEDIDPAGGEEAAADIQTEVGLC